MSTKEAREALDALHKLAGEPNGYWNRLTLALDELDARRAMDTEVKMLSHFAGSRGLGSVWEMAKRVLSAPWLKPCDGPSVTHNAGECG